MPIIANVENQIPCKKLAMVYVKPSDDEDSDKKRNQLDKTKLLQRKMSQSMFHEKRLLYNMNMIAVIPVP